MNVVISLRFDTDFTTFSCRLGRGTKTDSFFGGYSVRFRDSIRPTEDWDNR